MLAIVYMKMLKKKKVLLRIMLKSALRNCILHNNIYYGIKFHYSRETALFPSKSHSGFFGIIDYPLVSLLIISNNSSVIFIRKTCNGQTNLWSILFYHIECASFIHLQLSIDLKMKIYSGCAHFIIPSEIETGIQNWKPWCWREASELFQELCLQSLVHWWGQSCDHCARINQNPITSKAWSLQSHSTNLYASEIENVEVGKLWIWKHSGVTDGSYILEKWRLIAQN